MRALLALAVLIVASASTAFAEDTVLDQKVRRFLEKNRGEWRDMNVPWVDGQILHDLVVKNRFRRALEIGTSTGHSSVWIAWALSKTGGKLVTIEIDPSRHAEALRNFEEAGVAAFVDARLADAHELVKQLPGPFDFVFSDADKGWYLQYFKDVDPKLEVGGCFTAHNVLRSGGGGAGLFLDYVKKLPSYRTTVETGSGEGISVSCKLEPLTPGIPSPERRSSSLGMTRASRAPARMPSPAPGRLGPDPTRPFNGLDGLEALQIGLLTGLDRGSRFWNPPRSPSVLPVERSRTLHGIARRGGERQTHGQVEGEACAPVALDRGTGPRGGRSRGLRPAPQGPRRGEGQGQDREGRGVRRAGARHRGGLGRARRQGGRQVGALGQGGRAPRPRGRPGQARPGPRAGRARREPGSRPRPGQELRERGGDRPQRGQGHLRAQQGPARAGPALRAGGPRERDALPPVEGQPRLGHGQVPHRRGERRADRRRPPRAPCSGSTSPRPWTGS